jgi:hypothetical protein
MMLNKYIRTQDCPLILLEYWQYLNLYLHLVSLSLNPTDFCDTLPEFFETVFEPTRFLWDCPWPQMILSLETVSASNYFCGTVPELKRSLWNFPFIQMIRAIIPASKEALRDCPYIQTILVRLFQHPEDPCETVPVSKDPCELSPQPNDSCKPVPKPKGFLEPCYWSSNDFCETVSAL